MAELVLGGGLAALAAGGLAYALSYSEDDVHVTTDSVNYADFRKQCKTGDLILTSNTSLICLTRAWLHCTWSHCGILVKGTDGNLYEWSAHASFEGIKNTIDHPQGGAQLVSLDQLIADNGGIFWRQVALSKAKRKVIAKFVETMAYSVPFSELPQMLSFLGGPLSLFSDYGIGMVCSHVTAATYLAAEAIALDRNITAYTPQSFSDDGDASWLVPTSPVKMVLGGDMSRLIKLSP